MVEKTLILKQISGMLCLLNSYSKFTRPENVSCLTKELACANLYKIYISGKGDLV